MRLLIKGCHYFSGSFLKGPKTPPKVAASVSRNSHQSGTFPSELGMEALWDLPPKEPMPNAPAQIPILWMPPGIFLFQIPRT